MPSQTFTSSGTFSLPAGVTSVQIQGFGAGGSGGGADGGNPGAGGGGGAYAIVTYNGSVSDTLTITIGAGGDSSVPSGGGDTTVQDPSSTVILKAVGGDRGESGPEGGIGGQGGQASNCIGTSATSGSDGVSSDLNGTDGANGGDAANVAGGGGTGGAGGTIHMQGTAGSPPGGGGGGSGLASFGFLDGGNGAAGEVIVSWITPGLQQFIAKGTPALSNRMFADFWANGIEYFHRQARGLIVAMPMNERTGQTVGDLSGNANTGTIHGSGAWNVIDGSNLDSGGILGYHYYNASSTSYILAPQSPTFDVSKFTNGWTICFWFRGNVNGGVLVSTDEPAGTNAANLGWKIYVNNTSDPLYVINYHQNFTGGSTTDADFGYLGNTDFNAKWIHFALVVAPYTTSPHTTGTATAYINASDAVTKNLVSADMTHLKPGNRLTIGNQIDADGNLVASQSSIVPFKDLRIYNRPLTIGEIQDIFSFPDELYAQPSLMPFSTNNVIPGSATLQDVVSVTDTGIVAHTGKSTLQDVVSINAHANCAYVGKATLQDVVSVSAKSTVARSAKSTLQDVVSVAVKGTVSHTGKSTLQDVVSVNDTGIVAHTAKVTLQDVVSINAKSSVARSAQAMLQDVVSISAKGNCAYVDKATLQDVVSVTVKGSVAHTGWTLITSSLTQFVVNTSDNEWVDATSGGVSLSPANMLLGKNGTDVYSSWEQFQSVPIIPGSAIRNATFITQCVSNNTGTITYKIFGGITSSAQTAPATYSAYNSLSTTTAFTSSSFVNPVNNNNYTFDVSNVVREIVDANYWVNNGSIVLLIKDNSSTTFFAFDSSGGTDHNTSLVILYATSSTVSDVVSVNAVSTITRSAKSTLQDVVSVTDTGTVAHTGKSTLQDVVSISAKSSVARSAKATLQDVVNINATGNCAYVGKATLQDVVNINVVSTVARFAKVTLQDVVSFTITPNNHKVGSATLQDVVNINATGNCAYVDKATLQDVVSINATSTVARFAKTTLQDVVSINAHANCAYVGKSTLQDVVSINAMSAVARSAQAILQDVVSINAKSSVSGPSQVTLQDVVSINAHANCAYVDKATLQAVVSVTDTGIVARFAQATLQDVVSINAKSLASRPAKVTLQDVVSINAHANCAYVAKVILQDVVSISAHANCAYVGKVILQDVVSINAMSAVARSAQAILQDVVSLSISTGSSRVGLAVLQDVVGINAKSSVLRTDSTVLTTTTNNQVNGSAADGFWQTPNNSIDNTSVYVEVGKGFGQEDGAYYIFSITATSKQVVMQANLYLTGIAQGNSFDTGPDTYKIQAVAQDNAANPVDIGTADPTGSFTSALVDWTLGILVDLTTVVSPDITSVIQEVVNRSGWVSGNTLQINISHDSANSGIFKLFATFDAVNSVYRPFLHLVMNVGSTLQDVVGVNSVSAVARSAKATLQDVVSVTTKGIVAHTGIATLQDVVSLRGFSSIVRPAKAVLQDVVSINFVTNLVRHGKTILQDIVSISAHANCVYVGVTTLQDVVSMHLVAVVTHTTTCTLQDVVTVNAGPQAGNIAHIQDVVTLGAAFSGIIHRYVISMQDVVTVTASCTVTRFCAAILQDVVNIIGNYSKSHTYPPATGGLILGTFPSFDTAITDQNPELWFKLDESSGTTAINYGSIGSAVNGTYHGGFLLNFTSLVQSKPTDSAVYFGGDNGYISVPDNSLINSSTPYNTRTIELWFNALDVFDRQSIYAEGDINSGFGIYIESFVLIVIVWNDETDAGSTNWGKHYAITAPILQQNTNYHVALTFDGVNKIVAGYLNGILFGFHAGIVMGPVGQHSGISIGGKTNGTMYTDGPSSGTGNFFNGTIDEVLVFSNYMAPGEVWFSYESSLLEDWYTYTFLDSASGGLILSGTASAQTGINGSGGLILGGSASSGFFFAPSGGLIVGGSGTPFSNSFNYITSGGLIIGGSALVVLPYTASGGLILGGSASSQAVFNITKNISWNINANVTISQVLSWNLSDDVLRFYVVDSTCNHNDAPVIDSSCTKVTLILARNLSDVCEQLTNAGIITHVIRVRKYINPAFLSDFTSTDDINHDILVDVTPQFENISCFNLTVEFPSVSIGAESFVEESTLTYTPSGGLLLSGNGLVSTGSGGLILGGSASSSMPGFQGVVSCSAGSSSVIIENNVVFGFDSNAGQLVQNNGTVFVPCSRYGIPLALKLSHNLNSVSTIANFFIRNNLTLPSVVNLLWSGYTSSWQTNLYYSGISITSSQQENWSILFDLSCINNSANMPSSHSWLFKMIVKSVNFISGRSMSSSLFVFFDQNIRGLSTPTVDFIFSVNAVTRQVSPSAQNIVFVDDGFFADKLFVKNPLLNLHIASKIATNKVLTSLVTLG